MIRSTNTHLEIDLERLRDFIEAAIGVILVAVCVIAILVFVLIKRKKMRRIVKIEYLEGAEDLTVWFDDSSEPFTAAEFVPGTLTRILLDGLTDAVAGLLETINQLRFITKEEDGKTQEA